MNQENGTVKTMTLEEFKLNKDVELLKLGLDDIGESIGKEVKFDDCFDIIIEDGKIYTVSEIPEFVDYQKQDVTDHVKQFLTREMITELAGHIREQIEDEE